MLGTLMGQVNRMAGIAIGGGNSYTPVCGVRGRARYTPERKDESYKEQDGDREQSAHI
jgi:hypothetical protein